jgi:hypothetical protein
VTMISNFNVSYNEKIKQKINDIVYKTLQTVKHIAMLIASQVLQMLIRN